MVKPAPSRYTQMNTFANVARQSERQVDGGLARMFFAHFLAARISPGRNDHAPASADSKCAAILNDFCANDGTVIDDQFSGGRPQPDFDLPIQDCLVQARDERIAANQPGATVIAQPI